MPSRVGPATKKRITKAVKAPSSVPYNEGLWARLRADAGFRDAFLREAIDTLFEGELRVGRNMIRDYVNASIGFEQLARKVKIPVKSLMRMLGPSGNPQMSNLFAVIGALQEHAGIQLRLAAE